MTMSEHTDVVRELRERLDALQSRAGAIDPVGRDGRRGAVVATPPASAAGTATPDDAAESSAPSEEERAEEVQARNICLRLLADSARPRAGLVQKLAQRGISPAVIDRVLDRFTEVGLIDDQAYAEAYVRSKHQERSLSRRALTAELRRKGLDDAVITEAAVAVDSDAEEAAARRLIGKRAPAALTAGPDAARRRLLALLDRRGYPADLAIRVVESVLARQGE